jgi:hypothetical protein
MKNLIVKTKKMSLSTIEGKLTKSEMEQIMAGSLGSFGCLGLGILFFGTGAFGSYFYRDSITHCLNT